MKKSSKLLISLGLLVFILSGCSKSASNDEVITLFLSNNHVEDYPTSKACDEFARLVEEKTNGRIVIETYHDSLLGDETTTVQQVQVGGIDFARVAIGPMAAYEDSLNALQLPYLYRNEEHMWAVLNGEIGQNFLNSEALKEKGFIGLAWYTGGSRNFYNTKKEILTPDYLTGMKIRVQDSKLMMGMVTAMGAVPQPIAFADVYSAFEKGTIDGAENSIPSYISTNHYKIAKYITIDEHSRIPEIIIASKKTMDKLSEEDQAIIMECAKKSTEKQIELWKAYEAEALKTAEKAGCTITYLNENQVAEFQKAVAELNKKEGAAYIDIINAIAAVE